MLEWTVVVLPLLQIDSPSADQTRDAIRLVLLVAGLAIFSFGFVFLIGLWYLKGRDPHTDPSPGAGGTPPGDLPAAVAGSLIDERVDHADLVATLFDLQRRGIVSVEHTAPGRSGDAFRVTLTTTELPTHSFEQPMLHALFGSDLETGESVLLAERASSVAAAYEDIRRALYADLVERGYFVKSPEETRSRWNTIGKVLIGLAIILFTVIYSLFDWTAIFPSAALLGMGLAVVKLSGSMPAKTRTGAEEAARWRAFQRDLTDIARMGDAAPALVSMERHLPYALALGVSTVFVDRFSGALPVNAWANVVRDRVSEIDPVTGSEGWIDVASDGGDVLRGAGKLVDLDAGSIGMPNIDLPSVGTPSIDSLGAVSDAAGSGVQGASEFVMGLLNATPDVGAGADAAGDVAKSASGALGAAANLIGSAPGAVGAAADLIGNAPDAIGVAGDFLGTLADAAPTVIDAVGGIAEVVDAAEILEAAGSVLGALLEGLGDLDF